MCWPKFFIHFLLNDFLTQFTTFSGITNIAVWTCADRLVRKDLAFGARRTWIIVGAGVNAKAVAACSVVWTFKVTVTAKRHRQHSCWCNYFKGMIQTFKPKTFDA